MDDFDENVFLEGEMADFQFSESEIDGDKLEAIKEEANEASQFKKWFRKNASKAFINIAGIDSFINFLADMPVEERKYIESMMKEKSILGNPSLEIGFMLKYGLAFQMDSMYEGISLMSNELNDINRTLADESIQHIMMLKAELRTFATLIKKAVQVSMNEIEAASIRQQSEQQANYELKVLDLENKFKAAEANFVRYLETEETKHKKGMEEATMQVRKLALDEIKNTIKKVAGQALKESLGSYNMKHALYNCAAMFGTLTVFAVCYKLFT